MLLNQIQEVLNNYKPGSFIKVCWESDISSAKAKKQGISIIKRCEGIVRTGINYRNVNGVVASDSHKSWFEHCGKGLIQSKSDNSKKYLQLYPVKRNKIKQSIISNIQINGSNIKNLQNLYELGYITKSHTYDINDAVVISLGIENILKFGN